MSISVIIPTLQKNTKIFELLLQELNKDSVVSEIIIINNCSKKYETNLEKVRVINLNENLFVNPSWNLGVKEAKEEFFAIFNDDLLVGKNFCSKCYEQIKNIKEFGCMGVKTNAVLNTKEIKEVLSTNIEVEEDCEERCLNWGIIIFGRKSLYIPIPEQIKVWCGDDFIRHKTIQSGKKIFKIGGCEILHLGSLSSNNPNLEIIKCLDIIHYSTIDENFKNTEVYNRYIKKLNLFFQNEKLLNKFIKCRNILNNIIK